MSLNQPLLLSSALVHQVLLSPTAYPYKQVTLPRELTAIRFRPIYFTVSDTGSDT
jgi:hypothetical protein